MMQFGMPTLIENGTLEENIALCKELGLRFIELNMNFPEYQIERLEQIDHLMGLAERAGIYYTIHLDENLNIADFNKQVTQAYLETVRRSVEVAKKLIPLRDRFGDGSQPFILNMHMNHGIYITLPDKKVQMYDRDFETYMRSFEHFREKCEEWIGDADIRITVENTDGFRDYEKRAIEYLLKSPVFGLTWDIGHSKAAGEKDVPFIMEHPEHLMHFHIHDGSEKPPKNHLALGDGVIDIADRLKLAEEVNARCVIETKTIEALKKSVQWLNRGDKTDDRSVAGNALKTASAGSETADVKRLYDIVMKLRAGDGCPWDRQQTHDSLKPECIEEAAEVISGINILNETGDPENLKEELGDLLLQVIFHSVIAKEEGLFSFYDVVNTVSEKMIRRHPHVFSGVTYASKEEQHAAWEEIKKTEKEGRQWQEKYLKDAFDESQALIDRARQRKGY